MRSGSAPPRNATPLRMVNRLLLRPYSPECVEGEFCEVQSNKLPRITPVLCGRISYVKTKRGLWFCVYNSQGRYKNPKILARNVCRNVQETLARYGSEVRTLAGAERMLEA